MADIYKARRAYEFDTDSEQIVGRFYFIVGGEMADGTKCWYKCDKDGNIEDSDTWYSMTRLAGRMIAICEGIG